MLTWAYNYYYQKKVNYTGIDYYPVPTELVSELNYDRFIILEHFIQIFNSFHSTPENTIVSLSNHLNCIKRNIDFNQIDTTQKYDLIYHDAFAPDINPEFWELDFLNRLYCTLNPEGRLVTFCAKGQFKRDLRSTGFTVVNVPGPRGKREITIATRTH